MVIYCLCLMVSHQPIPNWPTNYILYMWHIYGMNSLSSTYSQWEKKKMQRKRVSDEV